MTVKARFKCTEINPVLTPRHEADSFLTTVVFLPVWNNGAGNETWSKATPSGKLEMNITNPAAVDYFELGADYELTLERVNAG